MIGKYTQQYLTEEFYKIDQLEIIFKFLRNIDGISKELKLQVYINNLLKHTYNIIYLDHKFHPSIIFKIRVGDLIHVEDQNTIRSYFEFISRRKDIIKTFCDKSGFKYELERAVFVEDL